MIEKINLELATFEKESDATKAIQDITKGIKSPFWKWLDRLLKENENLLIDNIIQGALSKEDEIDAKSMVKISRLIRELPERQLRELDNTVEEEEKEDFFGDEDPFEKK